MTKKALFLILLFLIIGFSIIYFNQQNGEGPVDIRREVKLYFSTKDAMYLEAELRKIDTGESTLYKQTINELIKGPVSSDLNQTIPEGVEILDIKVEDSIIFLSFNKALVDNHWGGSTGEILTTFSIVNTITQFPEIDFVRISIEGKEIETLAGHLDLSTVLKADEDLIKK